MDSPLSCVNNGGPASLIELDHVPQLEGEVSLSAEALVALSHWQARPGETLTVVDPENTAYRARITLLEQDSATCVPFQRLRTPMESSVRIDVYQSLPDSECFERVLQQLTELGVDRIAPLGLQRATTCDEQEVWQQNIPRWSDVTRDASRQCLRAVLPELLSIQTFTEALVCASSAESKLILYEGETNWTIKEGLGSFNPQSIALLVGPEGGFSAGEVEEAQSQGFLPVRLGPRVLRTETAAIVATTLVQGYIGDLR